jgi:hypothetical protein
MQAVATTMGSTVFIELPAAPTAMLNAAMLARKRLANDTLGEAMRIFAIDTRYKPLDAWRQYTRICDGFSLWVTP